MRKWSKMNPSLRKVGHLFDALRALFVLYEVGRAGGI